MQLRTHVSYETEVRQLVSTTTSHFICTHRSTITGLDMILEYPELYRDMLLQYPEIILAIDSQLVLTLASHIFQL